MVNKDFYQSNSMQFSFSEKEYNELYQLSISDPEKFWSWQADKFIHWFQLWDKVKTGDFKNFNVRWFLNGKLNACYNCIDRHLATRGDQIAIIWQGDNVRDVITMTYKELHKKICQLANILRNHNVKKGDRVCIYLPMIPEIVIAMLACARIGAIHSVVFGGFSSEALKLRILDADCRFVITADEGIRGGKIIPLKNNIDAALKACPNVKSVLVIKRTGNNIFWDANRDIWYHQAMDNVSPENLVEIMDANDPLFILYTSGSTGKPKGVLHTTGGYLVYAAMTHQYIFDYQEGDIYWCTADAGWITGHSYLVYGPLANGATTLIYEGVPHYPTFSRLWEIIDQHQVNIFYTAPTVIRALHREGNQWVEKTSRKSLKLLATVGEPIGPDTWNWYYQVVGEARCPVIDTWWQTETGGVLISPLPSMRLKPGSAVRPFLGIIPEIIDAEGKCIQNNLSGRLVIKEPWPGLMQTIYGDRQRFIDTYFKEIPGKYLTGDGAYQDSDDYYWITGRNDDVIKVSGHRIGTGELESALSAHPSVAEAAVVAIPHEIKGQSIYAYVIIKTGIQPTEGLKKELILVVREKIGPIAIPDFIQWTNALPKTRSGKIMRRILRKIACNDIENLGDVSTLIDSNIINDLITNKNN